MHLQLRPAASRLVRLGFVIARLKCWCVVRRELRDPKAQCGGASTGLQANATRSTAPVSRLDSRRWTVPTGTPIRSPTLRRIFGSLRPVLPYTKPRQTLVPREQRAPTPKRSYAQEASTCDRDRYGVRCKRTAYSRYMTSLVMTQASVSLLVLPPVSRCQTFRDPRRSLRAT